MPKLFKKDFEEIKDKSLNIPEFHTLAGTHTMKLKKSHGDFSTKNTWLIKHNDPALVLNEYIMLRIYSLFFGEKFTNKASLIKESVKSTKLSLGVELDTDYHKAFFIFDPETLKAGKYDTECFGKDCIGFMSSYIFSAVFDDCGIRDLNNFAIKLVDNKPYVVRYDFDHSLNFLQARSIVPELSEQYFNPTVLNWLKTQGHSLDMYNKLYKEQYLCYGTPITLMKLFHNMGATFIKNIMNNHKLTNVLINEVQMSFVQNGEEILDFYKSNKLKIKQVISDSFKEAASLVGSERIGDSYQLEFLPKGYEQKIEGLIAFIGDFIDQNFAMLQNMVICAKVESYLFQNKNPEFLYDHLSNIHEIKCSLMILTSNNNNDLDSITSIQEIKTSPDIELCDFANYYSNQAATYLSDVCSIRMIDEL